MREEIGVITYYSLAKGFLSGKSPPCAPNCFRPSPAGLSVTDAPYRKDRTETARGFPQEKSSRQGAVRPPAANHIRSQDRQT
jgi:hypothetical protein